MRTRTQYAEQALLRGSVALLLGFSVPLLQGCDSATGGGTQTSGGTTGAAGVTGAAGHANGGSTPTGGTPQVGGTTTASIPTNTGGTPQVGGTTVASIPSSTGGSTTIAGGGNTGPTGGTTGDTGGNTTVTGGKTGPAGGTTTPTGGTTTPTGGKTGPAGGITTPTGGKTGPTGGVTTPTGGITAPTGGTTTPAGGGSTTISPPAAGKYQMENLDRGVVAVKVSGGVYVGWRMFGTEYTGTDSDTSYNLYKDGTLLKNVTDSTNYLDAAGATTSKYSVSCVFKGTEGAQSPAVTPWAQQYTSIPLTPPSSSHSANDGSTGDLDGDGKLDIVLKWDPSNSKDNSQAGVTDDVYIDGYTLDGKKLWRIDLGPNIRAGAHYTQMSVGDFDGDGKAELAVKTAPGTKDGTGAYLSTGPAASDDDSAVYRNASGYILTGPEYVTVFAGDTGKELATIDYPVPRGVVTSWGDGYGNRVDRFNGGMAFVKQKGVATGQPNIIQQRGYYTRLTVSALTWSGGTLAQNWIFDSNNTGNSKAAGGGDHSCMAADVDNDGGQEIITGATTIESDGTFKCSSGMGHGDAMHIGELVVGKGISVFTVHETYGGMDCHDGATCSFYFNITSPGTDTGRGVAEYVDASDTTAATCSGMGNVNCGTGANVSTSAGSNFLIYWNADVIRSTMNGTTLPGVSTTGTASNNSSKSTPTLTADLLGDWREEAVLRESSNANLRVYTTTNVTTHRIYTLMHDPTYRAQVSFENSSYNQPPHVGFHIGTGMANPPVPPIVIKQ
ncbi:MAG: rhamnogalacturonan lyase [Polyangia bacterium]